MSVSVFGAGFEKGSGRCVFGSEGVEVTATWVSSALLICTSPAHSVGLVPVKVMNGKAGATSATELAFLYLEDLSVSGVFPHSVTNRVGAAVTVQGSNFLRVTNCVVAAERVSATVLDSKRVLCAMPKRAVAGPALISVSNADGDVSSTSAELTIKARHTIGVLSLIHI